MDPLLFLLGFFSRRHSFKLGADACFRWISFAAGTNADMVIIETTVSAFFRPSASNTLVISRSAPMVSSPKAHRGRSGRQGGRVTRTGAIAIVNAIEVAARAAAQVMA